MIEKIKLFGERNSGTRYTSKLLTSHFEGKILNESGWKHGIPFVKDGQCSSRILYIFVIRDVHSWIKSMFHNPYHFRYRNMDDFLFGNMNILLNTLQDVDNIEEEKGNIFDVRYRKIKAYKQFYNEVENCIIVNLDTIQNHPKKFLEMISEKYDLQMSEFQNINEHTKTGKLHVKNRSYPVQFKDYSCKINHNLEMFVNSLKSRFYFKRV